MQSIIMLYQNKLPNLANSYSSTKDNKSCSVDILQLAQIGCLCVHEYNIRSHKKITYEYTFETGTCFFIRICVLLLAFWPVL